jgi:HEAT repeat protein
MAEPISFQAVLDHLLDSKKDIPQNHLNLYSDLDPKSLGLFLEVWPGVKTTRKLLLLNMLLAQLDSDTLVSYEEIGRALLNDPDGEVRARAIRLLAESDDPKLVSILLEIFLNDADLAPRMEAVTLLGEFILLGELEKLNEKLQHKIEDALISVIRSEDNPALRRRTLEALSYSSRPELAALIESAFERADPAWIASALRAMGRSHDERWNEDVVSMLLNDDPRILLAAVEATGELGIKEAGPLLIQILQDDEEEEEEDEIAAATIWSLSQIGGDEARIYLVNLIENTEDEDVIEYLEDALENLDFNEELNKFDLLSLDEYELNELDELAEPDEDE